MSRYRQSRNFSNQNCAKISNIALRATLIKWVCMMASAAASQKFKTRKDIFSSGNEVRCQTEKEIVQEVSPYQEQLPQEVMAIKH